MKKILNYLFPKPTSEQKVNKRTEELFSVLTSKVEYDLSELETVLVINNLRRKLNESLKSKKNQLMSDSIDSSLRAEEVENAIQKIE